MQSIDFYTLPSTNYNGITFDDACIWEENIEDIETGDNLYVPNEFYDKSCTGKKFNPVLWNYYFLA